MMFNIPRMAIRGAKAVCLMSCFMLVSCATPLVQPASDSDNDAILQQLTELHQEIKTLKSEIGQLRQAVTEIHRASVAPRTVAPPAPVVIKVSLDNEPILGNPETKVAIVEFTDYQCPFCKRFHEQSFGRIKEAYIDTGKIQYIVRDFPLDFHSHAKGAAIAANCAGEQDAYWDMQHALFTHQRRLGPELYEELARTLKLDVRAFLTCLKDSNQAKEVDNDLADGKIAGVRGTPNFFVGRIEGNQLVEARQITGAQPFSVFAQVIDSFLQ